jgi:hypothetical protein
MKLRDQKPRGVALVKRETSFAPPDAGLRFEWVQIAELQPMPTRVRKHLRRQIEMLCASIQQFGWVTPLIAARDGRIIAGEGRLEAARVLELTRAPVIYAEKLTEAQIRAYRIADNQLAQKGSWDIEGLRAEMREIVILDPGIDIEAMGFEIAEADIVIGDSADAEEKPLPAPPETPISQVGDIFDEGGHSLICGDARDPTVLGAIVVEGEGSLVSIDPPWNLKARAIGGLGLVQHPDFVAGHGELDEAGFQTLLRESMGVSLSAIAPGSLFYCAIDWRHSLDVELVARGLGLEHINTAVWTKSAPGMGSMYRSAHEFFLVFRKPGKSHLNNIQLGRFGRTRSNVWTYPGAAGFGKTRTLLAHHPTPKPVALVADLIKDSTARGAIVIDSFSGSGTTWIAAEKVGRLARVVELDPRYCDVAIRRFEAEFGRAPLHRQTGLTLDQLGQQRASLAAAAQRLLPAGGQA